MKRVLLSIAAIVAFAAAQTLGLRGDYYLFGKALGGGLAKIAVLMVDEARYVPEFGLSATSTFSEDDLSITTALRALERSSVLKSGLGEGAISSYLKLKHDDWNAYSRHLTEWERQTTLDC